MGTKNVFYRLVGVVVIVNLCLSNCLWTDGAQIAGTEGLSGQTAVSSILSAKGYLLEDDKLPPGFEINQGQTDRKVKYLCRGNGYTLFLTVDEAVFCLAEDPIVVRMRLIGANQKVEVKAEGELPGRTNYFIGNNPKKWQTDIRHYLRVRYKRVYSGIDLVYYYNQSQLEYDFIVNPGANPNKIKIKIEGAKQVEVSDNGDLVLRTKTGELRQQKPIFYQEIDGKRQLIRGGYVIKDKDEIGFAVMDYDVKRRLIIDPKVVYSTYLGGSAGDTGKAIAVDNSGNAYLAGITMSVDFPVTSGSYQTNLNNTEFSRNLFIAKMNPQGTALVYSTYIGGSKYDTSCGIAVDSQGNAYVTGATTSPDFPVTSNALQSIYNGGYGDGFLVKINPLGNKLLYSTYLGGSSSDGCTALVIDGEDDVYLTGTTESVDFPVTKGAWQITYGGQTWAFGDAFVAKINPNSSSLIYSSYLGGKNPDMSWDIAVDALGNAFITGSTWSYNFPITTGCYQGSISGFNDGDAFVTKVNQTGTGLIYSTYLGGTNPDWGYGIAVDTTGCAYVAGETISQDFPVVKGGNFQAAHAGGYSDGFVTKIDANGTSLIYSTYLGGDADDQCCSIAVDQAGNACISGYSASTDFPVTFGNSGEMSYENFVTKINQSGDLIIFSTRYGDWISPANIFGNKHFSKLLALDQMDDIYLTGFTSSNVFPVTAGSFQTVYGGGGDAFVRKIATPHNIQISPAILKDAEKGKSYKEILTASGGMAPYILAILQGQLPPGLSFSAGMTISGAPLQVGTFTFMVKAKDVDGCAGGKIYMLKVINTPNKLSPDLGKLYYGPPKIKTRPYISKGRIRSYRYGR